MSVCMEMGNFIRLVLRSSCEALSPQDPDIYVDLEHAQPTETELEVYLLAQKAMEQGERLLNDLADYGDGATVWIREAIANPADEAVQSRAWAALTPLVLRQKRYYEFSFRLGQVVPLLLWELCSGPLPPAEQLEARQALAQQLAFVLHFVLRFDQLKMNTPALQNDFSFYRRTMSRRSLAFGISMEEDEEPVEIAVDEANLISFFYARATPMLEVLKESTTSFVQQHRQLPLELTTDLLATMGTVCRVMAETPALAERFQKPETVDLCLRVMVGAIVLYDHVYPTGAFAPSSAINMKASLRVLKQQPPERVETLMNVLRYHAKHMNDTSTPKQIRNLLA